MRRMPFELFADPTVRHCHHEYRAEELCRRAAADGQDVVIVNPAEVYGPNDVGRITAGNLIDFARSNPVLVCNGGTSIVHIEDVARGMLAAVERGRSGGRSARGREHHPSPARRIVSRTIRPAQANLRAPPTPCSAASPGLPARCVAPCPTIIAWCLRHALLVGRQQQGPPRAGRHVPRRPRDAGSHGRVAGGQRVDTAEHWRRVGPSQRNFHVRGKSQAIGAGQQDCGRRSGQVVGVIGLCHGAQAFEAGLERRDRAASGVYALRVLDLRDTRHRPHGSNRSPPWRLRGQRRAKRP